MKERLLKLFILVLIILINFILIQNNYYHEQTYRTCIYPLKYFSYFKKK
jgi:hypothetical protein